MVSTRRSWLVAAIGSACSISRPERPNDRRRCSTTGPTPRSRRPPRRITIGPPIFKGATWFHFSGTAAALGPRAVAALDEALTAAASAGLTVSCDLNYRALLWGDQSPATVMEPLMDRVDVLVGNAEDTERVFGIKADDPTSSPVTWRPMRRPSGRGADPEIRVPIRRRRPCAGADRHPAMPGRRSCPMGRPRGQVVCTRSSPSSIGSAPVMRSREA